MKLLQVYPASETPAPPACFSSKENSGPNTIFRPPFLSIISHERTLVSHAKALLRLWKKHRQQNREREHLLYWEPDSVLEDLGLTRSTLEKEGASAQHPRETAKILGFPAQRTGQPNTHFEKKRSA